jgi:hypothetical protein
LEQGLGLIQATLLLANLCQPIQIGGNVTMVWSSLAFVNFKSAPQQRLGQVQSTLRVVQARFDIDRTCVGEMLVSDSLLNSSRILLGERHSLVILTGTIEFYDALVERGGVFLTCVILREG